MIQRGEHDRRKRFPIRALGELHVVDGNSTKGVAMLWWRNLGACCKGLIFEIEGLSSVDSRKTG